MLITLIIATLFTVLVTALPLSQNTHWLVRGMDFPRLQIFSLALAVFLSIIFFLPQEGTAFWLMLSAVGLCIAWQLWWILPYTPFYRKEVRRCAEKNPERSLSIITSNVLTPNRNAQALIDLVQEHQPDILITLESDQWWEEQLNVLESDMPHTVKCPLDNLYGMHLYSRLALHEAEISFLVEEDVPSIHVLIQLRSGEKVRAHFVHPAPPSPSENTESAERDAELIIVGQSVVDSEQPVIVTGDLNDVAWSSTTRLFRKISGLLDPRIGRGMFNTFHVDYPLLRWPLDHIFHSEHFTLCSIRRLTSIGSDHFPLMTVLYLDPVEGSDQEGIQADHDDHERAEDIADEKQVDETDVPKPGEKA